jgi:hypothetical protein
MDATTAELSSVATALDDLTRRVTGIAERVSGGDRDDVANDLFEVERSLVRAHRLLAKVVEAG